MIYPAPIVSILPKGIILDIIPRSVIASVDSASLHDYYPSQSSINSRPFTCYYVIIVIMLPLPYVSNKANM